jgi:hypothetical protein
MWKTFDSYSVRPAASENERAETCRRSPARGAVLFATIPLVSSLLFACGGASARYPLASPLWVDQDRRPFDERPGEYFSGLVSDGIDHTLFRPISRFFAVDPAGEALNVNALDEVPDSSWFKNRIGQFPMSPARVAQGPCDVPPLDPGKTWWVSEGKSTGANPGFVIRVADGKRYLLKFDGPLQGPRATCADALATRVYWAAGYHTPCNRVVYFERSILRIERTAKIEDSKGNRHPLTEQDLDEVFDKALRLRDGRYRASSSLLVEGKPLGPWQYQGTRGDDPNDVVAHEDRRELRGMRILAAWINHFDAREQNTLFTFVDAGGGRGYVQHYVLDFGDSLGSLWSPPILGRRLGHSYYFDMPIVLEDWFTFGAIERPWDTARFGPTGRVFGYFDVDRFDPEDWRSGYPNPAFIRMQERDAAWMARIIARFSVSHIRSLVATADLRDPRLDAELFRVLWGRRDKILRRYLLRLSPLSLPALERDREGSRVCLTDLALTSNLLHARDRMYGARAFELGNDDEVRRIAVAAPRSDPGRVCVTLPPQGVASKSPEYLIVDVWASTGGARTEPPTRVHLYRLGASDYRIVGLERPDDHDPPG